MIRLKIDENRLTLDDLIRLEEGDTGMRFMRDLFARFVTDEGGEYLTELEARKAMGGLTIGEVMQVKDQFMSFMDGMKERAVPPGLGGS